MTAQEAAVAYAERGWPVFPLAARGKLPLIPSAHKGGGPPCEGECGLDGHGLHDATTDRAQIAAWWRRWPNANVGLRTGVAFDVVDIDGPEGLEALNAYRSDRPITWGPESQTGGGGWHLLHLPSGAGNRAGMLPKVDYRGKGGYIVAPPSVHPSGQLYRWAEMAGPDEPLEPLAGWLNELVLPPRPAVHSPSARIAPGRVDGYGQRALDAELGRVAMAAEGERNCQLNRSSFALGQLVASGVLAADVVVSSLIAAAARAGLTGTEVEKTIASGVRKGLSQPRRVSP